MPNGRGIPLGSVAGVEIRADPSLLLVLLFVTSGLASGLLPRWHPEWSAAQHWLVALAAAITFFASVVLHELSHALVARARGISVSRITLFLFGGLAHLENEPPSWRSELLMAAAGPLASLVIGAACLGLGALLAGPLDVDPLEPLVALRAAGPVATVLLWLGPVNLMLAAFNLVPGFPLDGGRVLRALVWGATGNLRRATRWASGAGRAFAFVLVTTGVLMALGATVPFFGTGFFNGLWLVLIGWFLNGAALASYRQLVMREVLADVPVERLMRTHLVTATPGMSIGELVDRHLMSSGQRSFPVEEDGRFVGLVFLGDLYRLPREAWDRVSVGEAMVPVERLVTVPLHAHAADALAALDRRDVTQVPVVDEGRFAGLVRREDVLRWLTLQGGRRPATA